MKTLLLSAALAVTALSLNASSLDFSYVSGTPDTPWGTTKAESYDVAVGLDSPLFVGSKVACITAPVPAIANMSNLSFWVSSKLELELVDGVNVNVTDLFTKDVTVPSSEEANDDGWKWVSVVLDTPVTVPEGGLYVGISFTIDKLGMNKLDQRPVICGAPGKPNALWVHSTRSYRSYTDLSEKMGLSWGVMVGLEGNFPENAAEVNGLETYYGSNSATGVVKGTIVNLGSWPLTAVGYAATVGDQTYNGILDLSGDPLTGLLSERKVEFRTPVYGVDGPTTLTVELTTVNGQPNPVESIAAANAYIADAWYFKRPLMEEYTGTGCGWCPRGFVAMDYMTETYGTDFCGVAWHTYNGSDPMAVYCSPQQASGFPTMFIDRTTEVDPYFGTGTSGFEIESLWLSYTTEISPVGITAVADFDPESPNLVNVDATVKVVGELTPGTYHLEYILVGDDVHGDYDDAAQLNSWGQSNAYNSSSYASMYLMSPFVGAGNPAKGLHFNDVGLLRVTGEGVISPSATDAQPFSAVLNLDDVKNARGNAIPYLRDQLKVIVALVRENSSVGVAVDCRQCLVGRTEGSLTVADAAAPAVVATSWYDLSGRLAAQSPSEGLWIRVQRLSDGTTRTAKVLVR